MRTQETDLDIPGIIALLQNGSIPPSQRIEWATEYLARLPQAQPAVVRVEGGVAEITAGNAWIIDFDHLVDAPRTCIICGEINDQDLDTEHPCTFCGWDPDQDLDANGLAAYVYKANDHSKALEKGKDPAPAIRRPAFHFDAYFSDADGIPVVHVETGELDENAQGPICRVYLNDGDPLWANPDLPEEAPEDK